MGGDLASLVSCVFLSGSLALTKMSLQLDLPTEKGESWWGKKGAVGLKSSAGVPVSPIHLLADVV